MITALGVLYSCIFIFCYIPQIVKMYQTKSVDDIAPMTYWLTLIACLLAAIYVCLKANGDFILLGNYLISASLSGFTLFLFYKYERNN